MFYFENKNHQNFTLKKNKYFLATLKYQKLAFLKKFNYLKWVYLMFMALVKNGKKLTNLNFYLKIVFFLKKKIFF